MAEKGRCQVCGKTAHLAKGKCPRCYGREYDQRPERKAYKARWARKYCADNRDMIRAREREYRKKPEYKRRERAYRNRPDVKARRKVWSKDYHARNRERLWAKHTAYNHRPDVIARRKAYYQRPDVKARIKAMLRARKEREGKA